MSEPSAGAGSRADSAPGKERLSGRLQKASRLARRTAIFIGSLGAEMTRRVASRRSRASFEKAARVASRRAFMTSSMSPNAARD